MTGGERVRLLVAAGISLLTLAAFGLATFVAVFWTICWMVGEQAGWLVLKSYGWWATSYTLMLAWATNLNGLPDIGRGYYGES